MNNLNPCITCGKAKNLGVIKCIPGHDDCYIYCKCCGWRGAMDTNLEYAIQGWNKQFQGARRSRGVR